MENLVPDLATCQKLRALGFTKETALVKRQTGPDEWKTVPCIGMISASIVPAPTFQEVWDQLPKRINSYSRKGIMTHGDDSDWLTIGYFQNIDGQETEYCIYGINAAAAAAELWIGLKREGLI